MSVADPIIGITPGTGPQHRRRIQVSFVVAAGMLLAAAVGLNWWFWAKDVYLKKLPVPMRVPFCDAGAVSEVLGNWVRVMEDELDPDVIGALKAYREKGRDKDDYLFCAYINATVAGRKVEDLKQEFAKLSYEDKRRRVSEYGRQYPSAVVRVGLSYYTGKADTVAHIPDRCFVAEGYDIASIGTEQWDLGGRTLDVRHLAFVDKRVNSALPACHVAYFFHVNGRFMSDSLAVRRELQNLLAKYAYYAKVELRCDNTTAEAAAVAMKDLLKVMLPEVERALPDWNQYREKK